MIVGTAGHIDHGKTALVKALTGVDADRLKEEKARGITIDLGYAYSDLGDGRQLGFVDVPGHERFVHNMLAGATGIDAALLVVSAAEGIKPQTVEHLQIIDLLGLDRGIVALTKADLANDDQLLERMAEVETLLASTSLKGAEIMPVSAMTGQGVDELKAKLLALGESGKGATGFARLAVDRCFVLSGAGVVVTGTVHAGEIKVDDHLLLTPSGPRGARALAACPEPRGRGRPCRRALRAQSQRRAAFQGCRAARRLGGEPRAACADRPASTCELKLLASESAAAQALGAGRMCISARRTSWAASRCWKATALAPGEQALAQLVLEEKVGALAGDRVILRDPSATRTHRRRARSSIRSARRATGARRGGWPSCARCAEPNDERAAGAAAARRRASSTSRASASRAICRPAEVERLLTEAGGTKVAGFGLLAETLAAARADLVDTLKAFHASNADAPGLQPERLRVSPEEALAAGGVRARCSISRWRPRRVTVDGALPAPARPFAEARREGRGAVEEDLGAT